MPDILHQFWIAAPASRIFDAVATPPGLDAWWTRTSKGRPDVGEEYELWFGPEHDWRGVVSRCILGREFELTFTRADDDWRGTKVGFVLRERKDGSRRTDVHFHHTGWREANDHFRTSSFCWAMYLRLLKRHVELGEMVAYGKRLDA
jgi:uncharacterized protein YndB with AHSA1/START domain